jgi:hypothetical protein
VLFSREYHEKNTCARVRRRICAVLRFYSPCVAARWAELKPSQWTGTNSAAVAHQHRSFTPPTKSFAIGKEPRGIAFDGANLWVANRDDNNLTELRSSDGVVVRTVAVRGAPDGVIFDGANIWVVNQGYNLKVDGSVTKLNSANGETLGIFPVGHHPSTAGFDAANIWVANTHGNTVTKLRAKDGA